MKDQKTAQKKNARKCTNPVPDFCGTQQNDLPIHGNLQSSPMDRARKIRERADLQRVVEEALWWICGFRRTEGRAEIDLHFSLSLFWFTFHLCVSVRFHRLNVEAPTNLKPEFDGLFVSWIFVLQESFKLEFDGLIVSWVFILQESFKPQLDGLIGFLLKAGLLFCKRVWCRIKYHFLLIKCNFVEILKNELVELINTDSILDNDINKWIN